MMSIRQLFIVAALIAVTTTAIISLVSAADTDKFFVEVEVANLDGEPGEDHRGKFTVEVNPSWAPLGAARFKEIVETNLLSAARIFRAVPGFVVQFGIPASPTVAAKWRDNKIKDDPVSSESGGNERGTLVFATSGKDSRTTQMFVNVGNNKNLDSMGFAPFGKVLGDGMKIVDRIYFGYGEKPNQGRIQSDGNAYLKKDFPRLSFIKSMKLVDAPSGDL